MKQLRVYRAQLLLGYYFGFHRAKVEQVKDMTVTGVFVDYGDRFFSTLEKVQPLTPELCNVPCLAIQAKLYGEYHVESIITVVASEVVY